MDKINRNSIKSSLVKYLIPCIAICIVGCFVLELVIDWYRDLRFFDMHYYEHKIANERKFFLLSKYIILPLWSALCLWVTVWIFYRREIEVPIKTLSDASEKILGDDLDFKVESSCKNELGQLCVSFEEMRKNLYDSNYELWKSLEERKRLNSAFSHDLRTPITVLKGYAELVRQFDGKLSHEKQGEILQKMSEHISRLEHYTEKMNSVQKLEDIIPDEASVRLSDIVGQLNETGKLLCCDKEFIFSAENYTDKQLYTDREIVAQVFENLVSNALRYTKEIVKVTVAIDDDKLSVTVSDDGNGFSEEALRKAWQPFYRDDKDANNEHFGLGLYICRLLCRKCGGELSVKNSENGGGEVTASFSVKKSESR